MRLAWIGAAVLVAALGATGPALAWSGRVTWTTWLRAGPGRDYTVVDEIEGGRRIEVLDCAGGWCRTVSDKAVTYIEAGLVARDAPAAAAAAPAAGANACVDSVQSGYAAGERFSYCPK